MIGRDRSRIILGALAIILAGLLADWLWGRDAFARSGAVLVIYGIVMVGRAAYESEKRNARNEARFEKLEATYLDASTSQSTELSPEIFVRLAGAYAELRESRLAREGQLIVVEVGIVCLGTFIWGFGDLVL